MHEVLYLSGEDVMALDLCVGEVVEAVEEAFRIKGEGSVDMPPKVTMRGSGGAFVQVMPAWVRSPSGSPRPLRESADGAPEDRLQPGEGQSTAEAGRRSAGSLGIGPALGVKLVTIMPQNAERGLPVTNALIVLDDPLTGLPRAIVDGSHITALRTGAGVGVAARHLAAPDVTTVGILGCGVQARAAARALATVLPCLTEVRCHDAVPAAATAFADELPRLVTADAAGWPMRDADGAGRQARDAAPGRAKADAGAADRPAREIAVHVCDQPAEVCRGAGVVVTAITMGDDEPPLGPGLLEPGALAVALDYDAAWSPAAMAECDLFVTDDVAQTLATKQHGSRLGGIPHIDADLAEIVAGRGAGRTGSSQRIFCLNLGVAVTDVLAAELVRERAVRLGLGRWLPA